MKTTWQWVRPATLSLVLGLAAGCSGDSTGDPPGGGTGTLSMAIVSGNNQSARVRAQLPQPLVVRVVDGSGNPVRGHALTFGVAAGGGSVAAGAVQTNEQGVAQDVWTMGPAAGENRVEVRGGTSANPLVSTFSATALPEEAPTAASVTVTSPAPTVQAGGTLQLTATARDANGNTLQRTFTWASSNAAAATVSSSGLVTAVAPGTSNISATAEGRSGSASLTVTPPTPPNNERHEPAGFVRITERPFSAPNEAGWVDENGTPSGGEPAASFSIATDATAPKSPGQVGAITLPAGYSGDGRTSLLGGSTYPALSPAGSLYLEFWLKVSENWYAHTGGQNKIFYIGHPVVVEFGYGIRNQPVQLWVSLQGGETTDLRWNSAANQVRPTASQAELVRGRWYRVEVLLRMNTPGQPNGEVHMWMNGIKTHQFVNRNILEGSGQSSAISFLAWRPIYGGQDGERVPAAQQQFLDHLYFSRSP